MLEIWFLAFHDSPRSGAAALSSCLYYAHRLCSEVPTDPERVCTRKLELETVPRSLVTRRRATSAEKFILGCGGRACCRRSHDESGASQLAHSRLIQQLESGGSDWNSDNQICKHLHLIFVCSRSFDWLRFEINERATPCPTPRCPEPQSFSART
jgi:hypothetical protein